MNLYILLASVVIIFYTAYSHPHHKLPLVNVQNEFTQIRRYCTKFLHYQHRFLHHNKLIKPLMLQDVSKNATLEICYIFNNASISKGDMKKQIETWSVEQSNMTQERVRKYNQKLVDQRNQIITELGNSSSLLSPQSQTTLATIIGIISDMNISEADERQKIMDTIAKQPLRVRSELWAIVHELQRSYTRQGTSIPTSLFYMGFIPLPH